MASLRAARTSRAHASGSPRDDQRHNDESRASDLYYAGNKGFAEVYDLCEAGCQGLLTALTDELLARERGA